MASAEIGEPLNPEQAGDGAAGHEHDGQAEKKKSGWNLSDTFLNACRTLSIVTAVTAVLCGIVNLVSAVRSFKSGDDVRPPLRLCEPAACNFENDVGRVGSSLARYQLCAPGARRRRMNLLAWRIGDLILLMSRVRSKCASWTLRGIVVP